MRYVTAWPKMSGVICVQSNELFAGDRIARERLERALSIRQPFSEMILTGKKLEEYRTRRTHIRGRVYLYAGKVADSGVRGFPDKKLGSLPRSLIVGSVEIVDCLESKKHKGYFAWKLASPKRYRSPLKALGVPQPGFWKPKF